MSESDAPEFEMSSMGPVCPVCGAIMADPAAHLRFHAALGDTEAQPSN